MIEPYYDRDGITVYVADCLDEWVHAQRSVEGYRVLADEEVEA